MHNPDLDEGAKKEFQAFLQEREVVQPKVARRGEAAAKQWNEILALPESAAVVEEMRSLTTDHPEHLTPEREKAFRDIAAGHDRHEERLRELSQGRGRSL